MAAIQAVRHIQSARSVRTNWDYMTCLEMSGNGAVMGKETIRPVRSRIQSDRLPARTASSVAGVGATTPGSAVRRTAAATTRRIAATSAVFAWFSLQFNEGTSLTTKKPALPPEPRRHALRQRGARRRGAAGVACREGSKAKTAARFFRPNRA